MIMDNKLIIATKNENKVKEMTRALNAFFTEIYSLNRLEGIFDIIEDGASFYDNAMKKALYIYERAHQPVLADDSGLCVEALDNRPGIFSSRYAGENACDNDNNIKLLSELQGIENRNAYFECCIILILERDTILNASGRVYGRIIDKPAGSNGFGYDPLFFLEDYGRTMAQLSLDEKNMISHRSLALRNILSQLKTLCPEK